MSVHDFGMPRTYCDDPIASLSELRRQLASDVASYLSKGGEVVAQRRGASGILGSFENSPEALKLGFAERLAYFKKKRLLLRDSEDSAKEFLDAEGEELPEDCVVDPEVVQLFDMPEEPRHE